MNIYIYLTEQPIIHGDLKIVPRPIPSQCVWMSLLERPLEKIKGFKYRNSQNGQRMDMQKALGKDLELLLITQQSLDSV